MNSVNLNYADGINKQASNQIAGENGLARLATQISEASSRVSYVAEQLSQIALGIHGPRPEPVSGSVNSQQANGADSLSGRINNLLDAVDRLNRSYEAVVR